MDKFFEFLEYLEDKHGEYAGILGFLVIVIGAIILAVFLSIITQGWVWVVAFVLAIGWLLKAYGEFSLDYKDKNNEKMD